MATITYTGDVYEGGKKTGTYTERVTYTLTYPNATTAKIVVTKVERKFSSSGGTASGGYPITFRYYNSSGQWAETSVTSQSYTISTTYQVRWQGTKTITTYRKNYKTTIYLSDALLSINTVATYNVISKANGGTGVPGTQLKYHGYTLYLNGTSPTKTGYNFLYYTNNIDSSHYCGNSGNYQYTKNQAMTLTAQWDPKKFLVYYRSNGGVGTVATQTKTYDQSLTLQTGSQFSKKIVKNKITHELELNHWNTKDDDSGTTYALGGTLGNILENLYLYAIWEEKYIYPYLSNCQLYRTASDSGATTEDELGEYIYISFDFIGSSNDNGSTYNIPECTITIDDDVYHPTLNFTSGNQGTLEFRPSTIYDIDNMHTIVIQLNDPEHSTSIYKHIGTIASAIYPIDLYSNIITEDGVDRHVVYMGLMHPYRPDQLLTMTTAHIDGTIILMLDENATSGDDYKLNTLITNFGWTNDVIV